MSSGGQSCLLGFRCRNLGSGPRRELAYPRAVKTRTGSPEPHRRDRPGQLSRHARLNIVTAQAQPFRSVRGYLLARDPGCQPLAPPPGGRSATRAVTALSPCES